MSAETVDVGGRSARRPIHVDDAPIPLTSIERGTALARALIQTFCRPDGLIAVIDEIGFLSRDDLELALFATVAAIGQAKS